MELTFNPLFSIPILLIYLSFAFLTKWGKRHSLGGHLLHLSFILYLIVIVALTFFPIPLDHSGSSYNITKNSWVPFHSTKDILRYASPKFALTQVGGNLALFLPFGFMLPWISPWWNHLPRTILLSFGIALGIEFLQLTITLSVHTNYRSFDVDDIGLNTIGALLGALLYRLIPTKRIHKEIDTPMAEAEWDS
ncbi:Glycopeptide antibiotics resistance protein [Marininema mesophilum]|uniref:Glycopeptide antibiotics resistance protein n=1 Tax=Marininema mesophilum TaxID=1048340 RepID=A0A1H2U4F3_9BACL|nr:VanZ family protein [Marininema mesophilum]SDW51092.1 Glycopeptide antibiotics resistance protein [Marininema mesophilum]